MPDRRYLLAAVAATAVLTATATATACGSSGSSSSSSKESTTTTASSASSGGASTSDDEQATSSDEATGSGENPGVETLVDGEAAADKTVTFTAAGEWDPDTLEVATGEIFTFKAEAGSGTKAVTFDGGANTYTISGGLIESFTLDTPGTYTVSEYLSGTEMTIEVSG